MKPVAYKDTTYGNLHHQDWGGDCTPLYALPEGYVIVPMEPTQEMKWAADEYASGHEVERLKQILRDAYEVWAGSEGIPEPVTAAEGYLLQLLMQMVEEVKRGL